MDYDEQRIRTAVNDSPRVIAIRERITQAKAEIEQAFTALGQLPEHMKEEFLAPHKERLTALEERETELVQDARRSAMAFQVQERLNSIRIEAEPKLDRASKCLGYIREALTDVLRLEDEARSLGGALMTHRFDRSSIDFVPTLTLEERGTWTLKR